MPSTLPRRGRVLRTGIALAFLASLAPLAPAGGAAAQQPAPSPAPQPTGALVGTVRDSLADAPLAGAAVQVVSRTAPPRTRGATTGADGTFRLDSLPAGEYVIGFQHPRLDALGVEAPLRLVTVAAGEPTRADLGIAGGRSLRQAVCQPAPGDSSGLVLGRAMDADTRQPLADGTIALIWSEFVIDASGSRSVRRQQTTPTSASGHYALCGVPTDVGVILVAEHGTDASGYVEVQVPPAGTAVRELLVGRGDAAVSVATAPLASGNMPVRRGTAALVGEVRTSTGEPVDRAVITLFGSAARDTTGRDGRFRLENLPAGTHTLETRVIGWIPQRRPVNLASGATDTLRVRLAERVPVLDRVTVMGRQPVGSALEGFLRRRRQGTGRFLTQSEIERRQAFSVGDLLRVLPGVRIENNLFDQRIFVRNCSPHVWLDGMILSDGAASLSYMVRPEEVAGVEVYPSLSSTPPEFQRMTATGYGGCGSIVVWTRGRLR